MSIDIQPVSPAAISIKPAEAVDEASTWQPDAGQIDDFAKLLQLPQADPSLAPVFTEQIAQDPAALLALQSKTMMTFMRIELLAKTVGTAAQGLNRLTSIA